VTPSEQNFEHFEAQLSNMLNRLADNQARPEAGRAKNARCLVARASAIKVVLNVLLRSS